MCYKIQLILPNTLVNVNEAVKPCRFLQYLNKNETNNKKLKENGKIRNLCVETLNKIKPHLWM